MKSNKQVEGICDKTPCKIRLTLRSLFRIAAEVEYSPRCQGKDAR